MVYKRLLSVMQDLREKKILLQFFVIFSLLGIIPVLITNNINYFYSNRVIESEITAYNEGILGNIKESVDNKMWTIFSDIVYTASDESINRIIAEDGVFNNNEIIKVRERLLKLKDSQSTIEEVCMCFPKKDIIISSDGMHDFEFYFTTINRFENIPYSEWKKVLSHKNNFNILSSRYVVRENSDYGLNKRFITIYSSLPIDANPKASIVVFINENTLNNVISSYIGATKNNYIISDNNGNRIAQNSSNDLISSKILQGVIKDFNNSGKQTMMKRYESLFFMFEKSPVTQWTYIVVVPLADIFAKSLPIKRLVIFICSFCVIINFILAIFLSQKMYRPLSALIGFMKGNTDQQTGAKDKYSSEYEYIMKQLNDIFSVNETLKDSFNRDLPFLIENLLYRILKGNIVDEKEIETEVSKYQIAYEGEFRVVSVRFDLFALNKAYEYTQTEVIGICSKVKSIIHSVFNEYYDCFMIDTDVYINTYILRRKIEKHNDIDEVCRKAIKLFENEDKILRICIGIGQELENITSIRKSYIQSLKALDMRTISNKGQIIIFKEASGKAADNYNYDLNHYTNFLLAGEFEKAKEEVYDVFDNCLKYEVSYQKLNRIVTEMVASVIKFCKVKNIYESDVIKKDASTLENTESFVQIDEFKGYIVYIIDRISTLSTVTNGSTKEYNINRINKYLKDNYNKEIGLDNIAEELNISSNYLSHLFKEYMGTSFPEYLGCIRIENAKELLKHTDKTINKICDEVGFINVNSFIRTFKKIEGITPGKYRSIN